MNEEATRDVVIDGVRSRVRTAAPAGHENDEEAVVFLHGNPGSGEDWRGLLSQAGDFARALAPDMPGYGKADRPRDFDYTVPGYGRHLAALLDALGVGRAHLVLHDFGDPWGLQFAADQPDRVAPLTLINIGVMPNARWHKLARIWRTPVLGELFMLATTRAGFRQMLNGANPKPFPKAFVNRMYDDFDWPMKRAVLALYRATDVAETSASLGERVKAWNLPALVVWGDSDAYIPVEHAETQKAYFDAEIYVLQDCGHWPMIDDPEAVADLVIPFLKRQHDSPSNGRQATPAP